MRYSYLVFPCSLKGWECTCRQRKHDKNIQQYLFMSFQTEVFRMTMFGHQEYNCLKWKFTRLCYTNLKMCNCDWGRTMDRKFKFDPPQTIRRTCVFKAMRNKSVWRNPGVLWKFLTAPAVVHFLNFNDNLLENCVRR